VSVRRAVPVPKPIPPPLPVSLERLTTPNRAGPSYNSDPVSAPRSQLERLSPLNQDLSEGHASETQSLSRRKNLGVASRLQHNHVLGTSLGSLHEPRVLDFSSHAPLAPVESNLSAGTASATSGVGDKAPTMQVNGYQGSASSTGYPHRHQQAGPDPPHLQVNLQVQLMASHLNNEGADAAQVPVSSTGLGKNAAGLPILNLSKVRPTIQTEQSAPEVSALYQANHGLAPGPPSQPRLSTHSARHHARSNGSASNYLRSKAHDTSTQPPPQPPSSQGIRLNLQLGFGTNGGVDAPQTARLHSAHKSASHRQPSSHQVPSAPKEPKQPLTARASIRTPTAPEPPRQPRSTRHDQHKENVNQPMSAASVLRMHADTLSEFEQSEILEYQEIYFTGGTANKIRASPHVGTTNHGFDDERGDYQIVMHDHVSYRFEVVGMLGKGSFGQVMKVFDYKTNQMRALKVIRNKKRFHHQALVEVKILDHLRTHDKEQTIVHMGEYFYFRNHLCISFELLSLNLYEFLKNNNFQGLSLGLIRRFAQQLLVSLRFLRKEKVIHCDLKPENILLKGPNKSSIKVIDFGSSCFEDERVYSYIQSRFYRSPEVILGLQYNLAIDMWSLGCILAELYTGYPLFPGENEVEQLACIMEVLDVPPREVLDQSTRKKMFFDSAGQPRIVANSRGKKRRPGAKDLAGVVRCNDPQFVLFLEGCLRWNARTRFTPEEALAHDWILETPAPSAPRSAAPPTRHLVHLGVAGSTAGGPGPRQMKTVKAMAASNGKHAHNLIGVASSSGHLPHPPPQPPAASSSHSASNAAHVQQSASLHERKVDLERQQMQQLQATLHQHPSSSSGNNGHHTTREYTSARVNKDSLYVQLHQLQQPPTSQQPHYSSFSNAHSHTHAHAHSSSGAQTHRTVTYENHQYADILASGAALPPIEGGIKPFREHILKRRA